MLCQNSHFGSALKCRSKGNYKDGADGGGGSIGAPSPHTMVVKFTTLVSCLAGAAAPNSKRSCAKAFPTAVSEDLLWVWADSSPDAAEEASAAVMSHGTITPHLGIAPELGLFGPSAYWSTKLGFEKGTFLGTWYQRWVRSDLRYGCLLNPSRSAIGWPINCGSPANSRMPMSQSIWVVLADKA